MFTKTHLKRATKLGLFGALALALTACVAPIQAPLVQSRDTRPAAVLQESQPLKQDASALPAARESTVFMPGNLGQTDPSAYPADVDAVVNAWPLSRTDPSAYPANINQIVNTPISFGSTDPSAYPADVAAVVNALSPGKTDPSAYPADVEQLVHSK